MLTNLQIKNFAIIDDLLLSLAPGLTILSGETGAGKSIIIGALNMVMGGRATADLIRTGEHEAMVEAFFTLPGDKAYRQKLEEKGLSATNNNLLIKRVISREGKNRVHVNGSLATLGMLTEISETLLTISGQHEHQELLRPQNHSDILDNYGGLLIVRDHYREVFHRMQRLKQELDALKAKRQQEMQRQELLTFQWQDIGGASLVPGEEEELRNEKKILNNAGDLIRIAQQVYQDIYEGDHALLSQLGRKAKELREATNIDPRVGPQVETLEATVVQLEDVALSLREYLHKIHFNPQRLEEIENRLETIHRLKKKYGATIPEILEYQNKIREEIEQLSQREDHLFILEGEYERARQEAVTKAQELSQRRKQIASRLSQKLERELTSLCMQNSLFTVSISSGEPETLEEKGIDEVEFLFSPNPGEELRPLARIASGGELSRVILSFKHILAQQEGLSTLIFDEVDSGIGGATAEVVGQKLSEISKYYQVICITHLPQIACFGNSHFSISKKVEDGRTLTNVRALSSEERVDEISRMLGGTEITPKTRTLAREMLKKRGSR